MTTAEAFLIGAGVTLGLLGGVLLWSRGAGRPAGLGRLVGAGVSESTRLSAGLGCLMIGYHLVIWSTQAGAPAVPMRFWPVLVGMIVIAVVGNAMMDRSDGTGSVGDVTSEGVDVDESGRR